MISEKKYYVKDEDGNMIEFSDPVMTDTVFDDNNMVLEPGDEVLEGIDLDDDEEPKIVTMTKALKYNDKIVCLGDDLTYGFGVKAEECWVGIANSKYGTNLLNRGMMGDPTVNLLYRLDKHVIPDSPAAVIIMGGSNDLIGEIPMEYTTQNLADICEKSLQADILPIMTIAPEPAHESINKEWIMHVDYGKVRENYHYLREWILLFCEANNIPLVDFDFNMKMRLRDRYGTFFLNGVHPDVNGHRIMAQILDEFFVKLGAKEEKDKFAL